MQVGDVATTGERDPRVARSRAAVLDAATQLLLDGGLSAITIDGLVAASGIAKTTIYRHWPGRAEVLWDTLDRLLPAPSGLHLDGPTDESLSDFIVEAGRDVIDSAWAPLVPALLDAAERDPDLREFRTRIVQRHLEPLTQILLRGIERGELAADLDVSESVSLVAGPMIYRRFVSGEPVGEAYCRRIVERFMLQNRP